MATLTPISSRPILSQNLETHKKKTTDNYQLFAKQSKQRIKSNSLGVINNEIENNKVCLNVRVSGLAFSPKHTAPKRIR